MSIPYSVTIIPSKEVSLKDIHKDNNVLRYMIKCQWQDCDEETLGYEMFAPMPEHQAPNLKRNQPFKPCPGSGKPGKVIKTIPRK